IALIADTHLGYPRFEDDAFRQADRAFTDAAGKADLILFAGDLFDMKIPRLETLDRAIGIFRKIDVPVYAIHGNHERRTRDMVNPVQLIAGAGAFKYLHGTSATFEKNGEKVQVFGLGSVPEEYATAALSKAMERYAPEEGAFRVLVVHQTLKELIPNAGDELSIEHLESLPFDLILNGHIHKTVKKLGGKILIPGSTVITQLKKEETESKGYFLYDTSERSAEFVEIPCRKFFYEELEFKDAGELEIKEAVRSKIEALRKENPEAIISIKIDGTLKEGLSSSDIRFDDYENVFIDNRLNMENLSARLEKIRSLREDSLSVRELAVKELGKKIEGKITLFNGAELFEKLTEGVEETVEYLDGKKKC
ncbi:TPA: DNA repair exonuclease, partial [Candidatus Micrarchaeota archaeon]|nr:DNA repair exonuclease [Candidatus Micrarchaeota archaeon]